MKYTNKLGLPIWNNPKTDVFDIEQFNKGNQVVDDIVTDILKKNQTINNNITNLTDRITTLESSGGGTGDSSGSGTGLTEEQVNNIEKIPSIESTVISNSQAIANKANKEEIETINSELDNKVNKIDLEVERKRINSFTKLTEGSTTGDAELIDGRVGTDGIIYDNLGDAIRKQLNKKADINCYTQEIDGLNDYTPSNFIQGSWNSDTGELAFPSATHCKIMETPEFFKEGTILTCTNSENLANINFGLAFYDTSLRLTNIVSSISFDKEYTFESNCYIKLLFRSTDSKVNTQNYDMSKFFKFNLETSLLKKGVFEESVNSINYRLNNLENGKKVNYYADEISNSLTSIMTNNFIEDEVFNFIIFSDTHYDETKDEYKNLFTNIKKINETINIDAVFHLGDVLKDCGVPKKISLMKDFMTEFYKCCDVPFVVFGNHDKQQEGDKQLRNMLLNKIVSKVTSSNLDKFYYYYDSPYCRYIVLNEQELNYGFSEEQINFLCEALLSSNGKSIVILSHRQMFGNYISDSQTVRNREEVQQILLAFKNKTSYHSSLVNVDFSNSSSKLISCFNGHYHCDYNYKQDGINNISVTNALCSVDNFTGENGVKPNKTKGTYTEIAFDIVTVQKNSKTIKITRFGSGNDRSFTFS